MFLLCCIQTNFIDRVGRLCVQNGRSNISTHWDTQRMGKKIQVKKKKRIILHSFNNMFSVKYSNAFGIKIG